jgi:hypothetical protein
MLTNQETRMMPWSFSAGHVEYAPCTDVQFAQQRQADVALNQQQL